MASAKIGALRIDLGLNSAAFEKGLGLAERRMAGMAKSLQGVADKMAKIGKGITIGISAPLAAMGGAILSSAKDIAASVPELEKLSKLANVSSQDFQRLAFAAKSVGFESGKLGDIYKDVNDKVGDFMATGGGEMKDFFENIAPKVGITADAFRNLSGPQALQLYYNSLEKAGVSQAEMTFYLEAIANDATALVPLLQRNGAAFDELGKKANVLSESDMKGFKDYTRASAEMDQALQQLTVAIVNSGLLDAVVSITQNIAGLASSLSKTNPDLLKWGVAIGGIGIALGPVILGLGGMVSGVGALIPVFAKLAVGLQAIPALLVAFSPVILPLLPILAALAGAAALVYAAYQHWDKIEPFLRGLYTAVKTWVVDKLNAIWDGVKKRIEAVKGYFYGLYDAVVGNSYIPDMVDGIAMHMARLENAMVKPAATATDRAAQAFESMASRVQGVLDRLFPESRATLDFQRDSDALAEAARQGKISAEAYAEAMRRLRREHAQTMSQIQANDPDTIEVLPIDPDAIPRVYGELLDIPEVAKKEMAEPFERVFQDMAANLANSLGAMESSLKGFADSLKRGDIVGIIGGIANIIGSVSGAIAGIKGGFRTPSPSPTTPGIGDQFRLAGFRALGGPVRSAETYMVGERGPELFTSQRAGRIIPNDQLGGGGGMQVKVVKGDMFDVIVEQISGRVVTSAAPGIAAMGAQGAIRQITRANGRSLG
ncbi:MAG: hypothetical protein HEQ21_14485 [Blastomonas sp.]|uniref:hypothetical protein n=1 Tax=Blastomonas sp. TaxID=1909299 RepID=UPI00258B74D1|nr:hypothetical protein [Blastomonas sp.]MCO5794026.1 hypothetical protein [Blastomonas sp.]